MKPLVAFSLLMILLLAGVSRIPPSMMPNLKESIDEACAPWIPGQQASNERNAAVSLKTLASAQADFRANDRDRDGRNHFWRGDVAGLYSLRPRGGAPLQLIERSVAGADDRPLPGLALGLFPRPFAGYRFRAIRHADEDPKGLDPNRFAFCAFPASPGSGRYIYIIDENNSVRWCVAEGSDGILVYPSDDELRMKWWRG